MKNCICHSKKLFKDCCEPFLSGKETPRTPVQLMRSRFAAYVNEDVDYLLRTWDHTTRPQTMDMSQSPQWAGLQIIKTSSSDQQGIVEFKATYLDHNEIQVLHETSRFSRKNGQWYYVDGDLHVTQPGKTGRNSPCPCGSGRKFKRCCL